MKTCEIPKISTEELDRRFDDGEDISDYVDWESARQPNRDRESLRVNVDFPMWMVSALDKEAKRLGVSRQALIKTTMDAHLATIDQRLAAKAASA